VSCGKPYPKISDVPQVVFDLDGTLAETLWPKRLVIGDPIPEGVAMLKHYSNEGYGIVVYTSRPDHDKDHIWAWILKHKLPVDKLVTGKPIASWYIDDRGINFTKKAWRFDDK